MVVNAVFTVELQRNKSRGSSVGIATGYGMDSRGSILDRGKR
jgi:hypothetical protein